MTWYVQILLALVSATSAFALVWFWQYKTGKSSIVDVVWSFAVGTLGIFFCLTSIGLPARRLLVALLAGFWSVRLGVYIINRLRTMPEDGRYLELQETWGDQHQRKMFSFYQFQAIGALLFSLPMLIASHNRAELGLLDLIGAAIFLLAIAGEMLADWQLHRFRMRPESKGKVCKVGLWRYSRHPNYFFEWVHWWSYLLFALSGFVHPWGWINILFPLAMYYFIRFKTGIPPTEQQAIKSRGQAYIDYQRTTNAFFPWFPKAS
ncbi:MAG TPA: DUF1295 domain-containing protein [Pirellulaceae bacterium]|nr:DUF1295 domain-containing protein [Pirellulaceae bacterium]HMO91686.1 DUF1295 domain-containing protein [Pirellulaceae bacterium]HMP68383.1 DUF1295 domain-containing protein [Pirellulaceae bacterium]